MARVALLVAKEEKDTHWPTCLCLISKISRSQKRDTGAKIQRFRRSDIKDLAGVDLTGLAFLTCQEGE